MEERFRQWIRMRRMEEAMEEQRWTRTRKIRATAMGEDMVDHLLGLGEVDLAEADQVEAMVLPKISRDKAEDTVLPHKTRMPQMLGLQQVQRDMADLHQTANTQITLLDPSLHSHKDNTLRIPHVP